MEGRKDTPSFLLPFSLFCLPSFSFPFLSRRREGGRKGRGRGGRGGGWGERERGRERGREEEEEKGGFTSFWCRCF
jgi:hypothetical protein